MTSILKTDEIQSQNGGSVVKMQTLKHPSSSGNNLVLGSDGSTTIANGTISAGTFNGTIGTSATHGNINLKRTITNNGVFTNGNDDDRYDILTMQDPGFYLVELGYWRSNSTNSNLKGVGQAFVQYIGGNRYTYYSRDRGSTTNTIDVENTGTTLQLKYNTDSDGHYTVQFIYIVVASHDI